MKLQRRRVMVREGDSDSGLGLVLEGTAEGSVDGMGRGAWEEGDYFGEMSLIDGAPCSATATAGFEGAETLTISSFTFNQVVDAHHAVFRSLLTQLVARIRSSEGTLG